MEPVTKPFDPTPMLRDGFEDPEMVKFIAGHIRANCRFPSGQARLGVEEACKAAAAALDAMRSWNSAQRRRHHRRARQTLAPAPGELS